MQIRLYLVLREGVSSVELYTYIEIPAVDAAEFDRDLLPFSAHLARPYPVMLYHCAVSFLLHAQTQFFFPRFAMRDM